MVKKLFRFKPEFQAGFCNNLYWSRFRWLGFGYDYVNLGDGTKFVQYGSNPVKFTMIKKSEGKPLLLYSKDLKPVYHTDKIVVGHLLKPIRFNFNKGGRNENRARKSNSRSEQRLLPGRIM